MYSTNLKTRPAFTVFCQTVCEGLTPAWRNEDGWPVTYDTEREAQAEIAELLIGQLQDFLAGGREFDDALTTLDFILPVDVWPDGSIATESGASFGREE